MFKKVLIMIIIMICFTTHAQVMTIEYGSSYNAVVGDNSPWKPAIVYDFGASTYYVISMEAAFTGAENNMGWMVTQFGTTTPTLTPIGDLSGTFNCTDTEGWTTISINSGTSITGKVAFIIETTGNYIRCDQSVSNSNGDWNYWPGDAWYHYSDWTTDEVNAIKVTVTTENPVPVELVAFNAKVDKKKIKLIWTTATENNNYGFEVERAEKGNWEKIGFVQGAGNSNSSKSYSFVDEEIAEENIAYRLKQIDFDGKFKYSEEIEVSSLIPNKTQLEQNYPNPFNPSTTISYMLAAKENVSIKVFDILGNEVATLVNENHEPGKYTVDFDASKLSSGIYFCRLIAGSKVKTMKMQLIK